MTITALASDEGHDRKNCPTCQSGLTGVEVIKHLEQLVSKTDSSICPLNLEGMHKFIDTPDGRQCYNCEESMELSEAQNLIVLVCDEIKNMLIEKNRKYGNSALNPLNIFAKGTAKDLLNSRIDDKLARVKNQQIDEDEDVDGDLIGYLVLRKICDKIISNGKNL